MLQLVEELNVLYEARMDIQSEPNIPLLMTNSWIVSASTQEGVSQLGADILFIAQSKSRISLSRSWRDGSADGETDRRRRLTHAVLFLLKFTHQQLATIAGAEKSIWDLILPAFQSAW